MEEQLEKARHSGVLLTKIRYAVAAVEVFYVIGQEPQRGASERGQYCPIEAKQAKGVLLSHCFPSTLTQIHQPVA